MYPFLSGDTPKRLCDLLRGGLFHKSFIKAGLALKPLSRAIEVDAGAILVDPIHFLETVAASFSELCVEIRTGATPARETFNAYWEKILADERATGPPVSPKGGCDLFWSGAAITLCRAHTHLSAMTTGTGALLASA